ncbi:MAG: M23 family metallopeptidase [Bacteroidia bacterium]|nr:M23 family metallopeptidase [Bacteroidia bacterium]
MKKLSVPYPGCKREHITQGFHSGHQAIDFAFANCYGTFLTAPSSCKVEKVITDLTIDNDYYPAYQKGYGVLLTDYAEPRLQFLFWHLLQIIPVKEGDWLDKGQVIGQMGNSGYCLVNGVEVPLKCRGSKGSHLHFETRLDGNYIDPLPLIDFNCQPKLDKAKSVEQFLIRLRSMLSGRN